MGIESWGFYEQGSDQMHEVIELGERLSIEVNCPVHFPAYGKNLFECSCGVIFPVYFLKGHSWKEIKEFHEKEKVIARA